MSTSFYNTTAEAGALLERFRIQAETQEHKILELFLAERSELAPSEVCVRADLNRAPLTSVRRAMTNLTRYGLLEKTAVKIDGPYGRPEHRWRLRALVPEQPRLL